MSDEVETPRLRRRRTAPAAPARPTLPATDAADSESPLTLSADAMAGTRDRMLAMVWTDEGAVVRRRADGVYEKVLMPASEEPSAPEPLEFYPDVELLDRRVQDPGVARDIPVLFKDEKAGAKPKYYKRWVDTHIPSRLLTLTQVAHYKKAEWSMLSDKGEIGDRFESPTGTGDPFVRRGEKGRYMLLFMPYANWLEIKTAQANLRTKRERSSMVEMAANQLGPQAAEIMSRTDDSGRPGLIGRVRELPPQSLDTFQGSGLPKDVAGGDAIQLEE